MFCDDNAQERGNIFTVGSFFVLFLTIGLRSSTPRVVATSDEHLSRCGPHIHTSYLSTFHQRQNHCLTLIMLGIFVVEFNCLILFYRCSVTSSIKLFHPLLNESCQNIQNKYEACKMLASTHAHIHDHQSRRTTRCFSRNTIQSFVISRHQYCTSKMFSDVLS